MHSGHLSHEIVTSKAAQVVKTHLLQRGSSLPQLRCAAALATHGYITEVKQLLLYDLDISLVPAEDMANLVKCVSDRVHMNYVSGDLSPVLSSIKCRELEIGNINLTTADTKSLVNAMEEVKVASLHGHDRWFGLDMETLAQYDGEGECELVQLLGDIRGYRDHFKVWAGNIGWTVVEKKSSWISIKRNIDDYVDSDDDLE